MLILQTAIGRRIHYGWVVVSVAVLLSLVMWGIRAAPSVLIKPLEADLGWSRSEISSAIAIGLVMTAFSAIGGGVLIDRIGVRAMMTAIVLIGAGSVALASRMTVALANDCALGNSGRDRRPGSAGCLAHPLAARWFATRQGLVQGILGAGTSAGQLIFLPVMTWLVVQFGWREATVVLAIIAIAFAPIVFLLVRDSPAELGLGRSAPRVNRLNRPPLPQICAAPGQRRARLLVARRQFLRLRRDHNRVDRPAFSGPRDRPRAFRIQRLHRLRDHGRPELRGRAGVRLLH